MSEKTLERAVITEPSPIVTPGPINTSAVTHALAPIWIGEEVNGIGYAE
jgi:hypothetical protein